MNKGTTCRAGREGFTLTEVIVASSLFFTFMAGAMTVYVSVIRQAKSGMSQNFYAAQARSSEQRIARFIEKSKFATISSNTLNLFIPNPDNAALERGELFFRGEQADHRDNELRYRFWPAGGGTSTLEVLVGHIGPVGSVSFFSITGRTVRVSYRVGDPADDPRIHDSGPGYQGIDVQFEVTPRNLQLWFD